MNFEKAFENYKNGIATAEEKAFVESEIAKARKINEVIDEMDAKHVVEPAESQVIKKAINKMKKKTGILIAVISLIVVLAVAIVAVGSTFIYVNVTASGKAVYTKEQCIEAAKQIVTAHTGDASGEVRVYDLEKDLRFEYGKLSSAMYVYEIEVGSGYMEYDVVVDSVTGKAVITDIGD